MKTNGADAYQQPTTMVHSQNISFDRDPSLWRTHTVPSASHACTEPALLPTRAALSTAGLATIVFFSSNPQLCPKYDRRDSSEWNHSAQYFKGWIVTDFRFIANIPISFDSLTRFMIFSVLYSLI